MDENILQIQECIERCKETPVLVEGKKDRACLEALGFTDITILDGPLFEVVERIEARKLGSIQILTDLDPEGRRLYSKLKQPLEERGIRVDDELRNLLWKSELRQIEGLCHYIDKKTR